MIEFILGSITAIIFGILHLAFPVKMSKFWGTRGINRKSLFELLGPEKSKTVISGLGVIFLVGGILILTAIAYNAFI